MAGRIAQRRLANLDQVLQLLVRDVVKHNTRIVLIEGGAPTCEQDGRSRLNPSNPTELPASDDTAENRIVAVEEMKTLPHRQAVPPQNLDISAQKKGYSAQDLHVSAQN